MRIILLLTVLGISVGCAHRSRLMPIGPEDQVLEDVRFPLVAGSDPQGELRIELFEEQLLPRERGSHEVLRLRVALANGTSDTAVVDMQEVRLEDQEGRVLPVLTVDLPGSNEEGALVVPAGERAVADIRFDAPEVERLVEIVSAFLTVPYRLGDEEYRGTVVYERIWPQPRYGGLFVSFYAAGCDDWGYRRIHHHFHRPPRVARLQVKAISAGGTHLTTVKNPGTVNATSAGGTLKAKSSGSRKSSRGAAPGRSRSGSSKSSSSRSSPSRSRSATSHKSSGRSHKSGGRSRSSRKR